MNLKDPLLGGAPVIAALVVALLIFVAVTRATA
jgi:hypothetical protein